MKTQGFTMVEMIFSLIILAMITFSLGTAMIHTRKSSEAAIYQATALAAVSSYLEQIKSMDYPNLVNAIASPSTKPLPTQSDDNNNDYLYVGQANVKNIATDVTSGGQTIKTFPLTITPTLTDLNPTLNINAIEIVLTYSWKAPNSKSTQTRALRTIRSLTPSY